MSSRSVSPANSLSFVAGLRNRLTHPLVAFGVVSTVWLLANVLKMQGKIPFSFGWVGQQTPNPVLFCAIVLACCGATILAGRRDRAHGDWVNTLSGVGFTLYLAGPIYTVAIFAIACAVYVIAPRITGYVGMIGTGLALLLLFYFVVPSVPMSVGWISLRFVSFVFDAKAIRKRSFISFLAYAPFGILLLTGEPPMISILTYRTKRPQKELDDLGAVQLLRAAGKLVLLYALSCGVLYKMHTIGEFTQLPSLWRAVLIPTFTVIFYLTISSASDFNTGASNLAGNFAPSAFEAPFLADTPFEFWRRWNTYVLGFLRTTCMYPMGKKKFPLAAMVFISMIGSGLLHSLASALEAGPNLVESFKQFFLGQAVFFPIMAVLLIATIPWEKRRPRIKWPGILLTQAFFAALIFPAGMNLILEPKHEALDELSHFLVLRDLFK